MAITKVYCRECKWNFNITECRNPVNLMDDFFAPNHCQFNSARKRNEKNECTDFEGK
jgi:hypothetical protein